MLSDALHQLVADCKDRIERGQRVLENHRQTVAPDFIQLFFRHRQKVLVLEYDASLRHGSASSKQPHNRK